MRIKNDKPIIVALDVPTRKDAEKLVSELIDSVRIFKVGHRLFLREGINIVRMIQDKGGEVFLDLKFHDIPSVIANAMEAVLKEKVYMLTVHSLGGRAMLEQVVKKVKSLSGETSLRKPLLLGITILTSLDDEKLKEMGFSLPVKQEVLKLAKLAEDCNLDGVVCSGKELSLIRNNTEKSFLVVVPGVRTEEIPSDDQSRVISVEDAIKTGADYLVMGRSITESEHPKKKLELILQKISKL